MKRARVLPPEQRIPRRRARPCLRGLTLGLLASLSSLTVAPQVDAFCGFYVAKADADLWNEASQVAIVRDGERTVLTMANDYKGELEEFAIVVPVPVVLERDQIHVGERALMDRLDAFSAPRLVEYHDDDPCRPVMEMEMMAMANDSVAGAVGKSEMRARSLGVTIEASYTVGEYDILILSATQSDGLETWLVESGYKLPTGASKALQPYIRQGLKFFVAKVNLEEQSKTGYTYLRPLQMAFDSPRFMLPIRLGMLNARGPQDLVVYVLTRKGRVETANYRTVRIPSDVELPSFVKTDFKEFYRAMFERSWTREGRDVAFLEYFWDMSWCDPCAANPLTAEELRALGVFWVGDSDDPRGRAKQGAQNVLLTRLHVRYDAEHFPEDLMFQETRDRQNFQGRYVVHNPWTGAMDCDLADGYRRQLRERQDRWAETMASLTGWSLADVHDRMTGARTTPIPDSSPTPTPTPTPWWRRIWGGGE